MAVRYFDGPGGSFFGAAAQVRNAYLAALWLAAICSVVAVLAVATLLAQTVVARGAWVAFAALALAERTAFMYGSTASWWGGWGPTSGLSGWFTLAHYVSYYFGSAPFWAYAGCLALLSRPTGGDVVVTVGPDRWRRTALAVGWASAAAACVSLLPSLLWAIQSYPYLWRSAGAFGSIFGDGPLFLLAHATTTAGAGVAVYGAAARRGRPAVVGMIFFAAGTLVAAGLKVLQAVAMVGRNPWSPGTDLSAVYLTATVASAAGQTVAAAICVAVARRLARALSEAAGLHRAFEPLWPPGVSGSADPSSAPLPPLLPPPLPSSSSMPPSSSSTPVPSPANRQM